MSQNTSEAIPPTIERVRLALGGIVRVHMRFLRIFARWLFHWLGFTWRSKSKGLRTEQARTGPRFWLYLAMILVGLHLPGLAVAGFTFVIMGEEYAMSVCRLLIDLLLMAWLTIFLFGIWMPFVWRLDRRFRCLTCVWSTLFIAVLVAIPIDFVGEWHRMHQLVSRAKDIDRKLEELYQLERRITLDQSYQLPNCGDSQRGEPNQKSCTPTVNAPNRTE